MNRPLTALFAALEALLVVAIGVGIPLVPLTILWAFQYGLQIDWVVFARAAVDIWLLGSGVDVTMTLNPAIVSSLGFAGAGAPVILTIAPLGFAVLSVLLGVRAGRRIGETPHRITGLIAAVGTFAIVSLGVTLSVVFAAARPSIWQGAVLPPLVFAVGLAIGAELGRRSTSDAAASRILRGYRRIRPGYRAIVTAALSGGTAAVAGLLAVSAVLVSVLFLGSYGKIIAMYESMHAGFLGGIALTVGQLAFIPNLVIWAGSWLVGPGFAVGSGSSVSPLGTQLGPIPAVPILGALPGGSLTWGFLGLLIPVLLGFLAAIVVRGPLLRSIDPADRVASLVVAGVLIGVVGGVVFGLLAWASAGSAGPGRLMDVGPSPWAVGGFAAIEFAVPAIIALFAGRPRRS